MRLCNAYPLCLERRVVGVALRGALRFRSFILLDFAVVDRVMAVPAYGPYPLLP
jgi:hypothetical protein